MKQKHILYIVVIVLICAVSPVVSASIFGWNVYESDYFVVFYPQGYKYQAEEVLYYLEKYRQDTMDLVGNENDFKTLVILQDAGLESNGAAVAANHKIHIFTNNPSTLSRMEGFEGYNSWFKQVAVHEMTHLAQVSNASGLIGQIAKVGGGIYSPNLHTPLWMKEGIAVYSESRLNEYEGRLNNGYYDSFIASRVQTDQIPNLMELTYGDDVYIYGAKFIDYLSKEYGEEKLSEFFKEHSNNLWAYPGGYLPAMGIDSSANQVFDKSFPQLYEEWVEYEKVQFQDWDMNAQQIINNREGKISKLAKYEDKLYYIKDKVYKPAPYTQIYKPAIMEYDIKNEKETEIDELESGSNASLQVVDNKIYYSTKVSGIGVLYSYNLETGDTEGHSFGIFKDFFVMDNGDIIYVKDAYDGYGSEIWKFDADDDSSTGINKIGKVNQLISEIIVYKDSYIVVSKERFGSWNINYLQDDQEDSDNFSVEKIINSPYLEKSIKLVGNTLNFTANYNNNYAIYQYNLSEDELTKVTSVSYASDGLVDDEKVYFVGVTNQGEGIYQTELKPQKYPLPEEEQLEEFDMNIVNKEEKDAFSKSLSYLFKPYVRFPYLKGEDALGSLSYRVDYFDDFNSTIIKQTPGSIFNIWGVNNYKGSDGDRKTNLQIHYEKDNNLGNFIVGKDIFYLDYTYLKSVMFKNSSFNLEATGIFAPKVNGMEFVPEEPYLSGITGFYVRLGYTHKLLGIEKGFWNPNIYLGDIYGNAYIDTYGILGVTDNYDPYYPYPKEVNNGYYNIFGYEISPETMMGFNDRLLPTFGIRYKVHTDPEDNLVERSKVKYYFGFSSTF